MDWIGLQIEGPIVKLAKARLKDKKIEIDLLRSFPLMENESYVKPLYLFQSASDEAPYTVITGLEASDILIRDLDLKLTDTRKILASLPFQLEDHIPYPPEETVVVTQIFKETGSKSSRVSVYATKIASLERHLETLRHIDIDPEQVSSAPSALCRFVTAFFPEIKKSFLFHFGARNSIVLCLIDGKVESSHSFPIGMEHFLQALEKDCSLESWAHKASLLDFLSLDPHEYPHLHAVILQSHKEIDRIFSFFETKSSLNDLQDVILTGNFSPCSKFRDFFSNILPQGKKLCPCPSYDAYDATTLEAFAIPIGLALDGLSEDGKSIQFRQKQYASPTHQKKTLKMFFSYALACFVLTASFFLAASMYVEKEQKTLMETVHAYFPELSSLKISTLDHLEVKLKSIELSMRKDKTPYPLTLPMPNVSEVLVWLSALPSLNPVCAEDETPPVVDIKHLKYEMLKHPKINAASIPYAVRVDVELETSSSHVAREFHQALVKDNPFVDPKKEVAWSGKGTTYKTSFFLRSKGASS